MLVTWALACMLLIPVPCPYSAGHYARIRPTPPDQIGLQQGKQQQQQQPRYAAGVQLLRGADPSQDQSYFLASVTQQALRHHLFPVGQWTMWQKGGQAWDLLC